MMFPHIIMQNGDGFLANARPNPKGFVAQAAPGKVFVASKECVLFLFYYFNTHLHFPAT